MKPCEPRWQEELADHSLGMPASAGLTEHLATCAACSEVLRQWKAQMAQVDAGVQNLAAWEPAAHSASRIMAELHARRPRSWLPLLRWQWRMAIVVGLVIVIASFILVRRVRQNHREAERVLSAAYSISSWRSPTESLLRSSTDRWLKAPPQFGKYFYPLSTTIPRKGERP